MKIKAGFVVSVVKELNKIPEVKETFPVTGGIDIITKVKGRMLKLLQKPFLPKYIKSRVLIEHKHISFAPL